MPLRFYTLPETNRQAPLKTVLVKLFLKVFKSLLVTEVHLLLVSTILMLALQVVGLIYNYV